MITSFAAFLESLQAKEAAILAEENVKHAPTIGDMYEGLTKELLERAIPPNLGLRLVDGFVIGVDGKPGNQIDALGRWRTASAFAAGGRRIAPPTSASGSGIMFAQRGRSRPSGVMKRSRPR